MSTTLEMGCDTHISRETEGIAETQQASKVRRPNSHPLGYEQVVFVTPAIGNDLCFINRVGQLRLSTSSRNLSFCHSDPASMNIVFVVVVLVHDRTQCALPAPIRRWRRENALSSSRMPPQFTNNIIEVLAFSEHLLAVTQQLDDLIGLVVLLLHRCRAGAHFEWTEFRGSSHTTVTAQKPAPKDRISNFSIPCSCIFDGVRCHF
jgi:hypothetical protein